MKILILIFYAILVFCLLMPGCDTSLIPPAVPNGDTNEEPGITVPSTLPGTKTLMILQIGASTDGNISHSFVELYNNTGNDINLEGYSLQYAEGTKVIDEADADGEWQKINLSGTINAGHSFLILGNKGTGTDPALSITDKSGDINADAMELNNRAVKAALIHGTNLLTVQNPFTSDGAGSPVDGYVDMIGVINNSSDQILGYEGPTPPQGTAPFRITKQVGVRRISLNDTDVNADDFAMVTYADLSPEENERKRPKNHAFGAWDPFGEPETKTLMILQANTYGNNNSTLGSGFSRSIVELYNNSDVDINLTIGNYYLHIGDADAWTNQIKLEGTIPSKSSFLIVDNKDGSAVNGKNSNVSPRAVLPAADQYAKFVLGNSGFKVAVLRNQAAPLAVDNPYGYPGLSASYVDMLGVSNSNGSANAYETSPAAGGTRPQVPRRKSLGDTDNNSNDFAVVDYRGSNDANLPADKLYKYWPRNSVLGRWNPISGEPRIDPEIPVPDYSVELGFSKDSGLYAEDFDLVLTGPMGSTIYYSRDGSIPSPEKVDNVNVFEYAGSIPIQSANLNGHGNANLLSEAENSKQMRISPDDPKSGGRDPTHPYWYVPSDDQVPKSAVIRALAIDGSGKKSELITKVYFIGALPETYGNHPIISLVSDPDNLVGEELGIMVRGDESKTWQDSLDSHPERAPLAYNFQQKGREWEREAHMEIFSGTGSSRSVSLSTGVGIRVRGGVSRRMQQKSLNVYFREEYGIKNLKNYPLIPGAYKADGKTPVDQYKSFVLRNGGNDTEMTKIYDALAQDLISDRNFTIQAQSPCIVYINGEYWGPYNLCEKYGDNHTEYKYGVTKDNVISYDNNEVDDGVPSDQDLYRNMIYAGRDNDMAVQENYEAFCETYVDIDSLIDYFAAELYLYNCDWPEWNYRLWRTRTVEPGNPYGDTKWRWQVYDMDGTMGFEIIGGGILRDGKDAFKRILDLATNQYSFNAVLFRSLLRNESFCRQFVNTMLDLHNVNFHYDNWKQKLDNYSAVYLPLMFGINSTPTSSSQIQIPSYYQRWRGSYGDFGSSITGIESFAANIGPAMVNEYLPDYFGGGSNSTGTGYSIPDIGIQAGGLHEVTISASNGGAVKINTITVNSGWKGVYYAGNPVTVSATPPAGFDVTWTVEGGNVIETIGNSAKVEITGDDAKITANFVGK